MLSLVIDHTLSPHAVSPTQTHRFSESDYKGRAESFEPQEWTIGTRSINFTERLAPYRELVQRLHAAVDNKHEIACPTVMLHLWGSLFAQSPFYVKSSNSIHVPFTMLITREEIARFLNSDGSYACETITFEQFQAFADEMIEKLNHEIDRTDASLDLKTKLKTNLHVTEADFCAFKVYLHSLGETVVDNSLAAIGARFTLAHELGHAILQHDHHSCSNKPRNLLIWGTIGLIAAVVLFVTAQILFPASLLLVGISLTVLCLSLLALRKANTIIKELHRVEFEADTFAHEQFLGNASGGIYMLERVRSGCNRLKTDLHLSPKYRRAIRMAISSKGNKRGVLSHPTFTARERNLQKTVK